MPFALDPTLQVVTIEDFSPGIVRYGRGTQPVLWSTKAPLGSAAHAFGCIARPGIGLVPFASLVDSTLKTNVPTHAILGGSVPTLTGFATSGPATTAPRVAGGVFAQTSAFADEIFVAFDFLTSAGVRCYVTQRVDTSLAVPATLNLYEVTHTDFGHAGISFAHLVMFPALASADLFTFWTDTDATATQTLIYQCGQGNDALSANTGIGWGGMALFTHAGRIAILLASYNAMGSTGLLWSGPEQVYLTDPPFSTTFIATPNTFDQENATGYGAWGSVSTGELLLVRMGRGAVLVQGDLLAPSSALKLPAVTGTGRAMQRATPSPAGMVYCTEFAGAWAWNGGNTSLKISQQIPDDSFNRSEIIGQTQGVTHIHDSLDQYVFFPNNWVYDTITGSWWLGRDPTAQKLAAFARASIDNSKMWTTTGVPEAGSQFKLYYFDFQKPAPSWTWVSNPLGLTKGQLVDLRYCEIVASMTEAVGGTITVTAAGPGGIGSSVVTPISHANNPNTLTFNLPSGSNARRLSLPMGFTDYNAQITITAASNDGTSPAPTLHEISLGYSGTDPTSGV